MWFAFGSASSKSRFSRTRRQSHRSHKHRVRPQVEAMEARRLLTVAFQPVYGPEQTFDNDWNGLATSLKSPNIYPIFWGSYWQSNPAAVTALASAFAAVTESAYLSGTAQYNTSGNATLMGDFGHQIYSTSVNNDVYVDGSNVQGTISPNSGVFTSDPISQEVENIINNPSSGIPNPTQLGATPIYVVITPPSVQVKGINGFNEPADNYSGWYHEVAWVAAQPLSTNANAVNQDLTTMIFSHEIAEAMTDPNGTNAGTSISPGPGNSFPGNTSAGAAEFPGQICDNEPNNNYYYRVGGPAGAMVMAFWSQYNPDPGYYIVPDGNSLTMQIDPNPWTNLAFNGGSLVINANQSGVPSNFVGQQQISIGSVQMPGNNLLNAPAGTPGVQVVMDGETFDFEPGQITAIQLNGGSVTQTINLTVNSLPAGVNVAVSGGSVNWKLKVVDNAYSAPTAGGGPTILVTSSSVTADGTVIQFGPSFNLSSLEVDSGESTVTVQSTRSNTPVTIVGGPDVYLVGCSSAVSIKEAGSVIVGAGVDSLAGSLTLIGALVSVTNCGSLTVDDTNDQTHNPIAISGTAILYGPLNHPLVTIDDSVEQLTIDAGPGTQHISLDISNDTPTTIIPLGPCTVSLVPASGNLAHHRQ